MPAKRLVVAGTGSSVGKTTVTIGLMAALRRIGLTVQGFKCGPDYIDPTYHTYVTGRKSRNLDSWMCGPEAVKEIYVRGRAGADISIIEGVMGLYDGKDPRSNEGSAAHISRLLNAPVLLVVGCQSVARSAAAIVKGFQLMSEEGSRIVGVFANKVGSEHHFRLVKEAVEQECGIPVLGYMLREEGIEMPERHLGLVPAIERGELEPLIERLSGRIAANADLDRLVELATAPELDVAPDLFAPPAGYAASVQPTAAESAQVAPPDVRAAAASAAPALAIALDSAFHFYYPENLELLERFGARLVYFSPLAGEGVPEEADGLYIGGGFPEEFAAQLAERHAAKESVRARIEGGLPTLAECGGYMFLTESIENTRGERYPMVGVVPGRVRMQPRLAALGYREAAGSQGNFLLAPNERARGHEFHYSVYEAPAERELPYAYETTGMRGTKREGYRLPHLVAGYTHLHFASNPDIARRFVRACGSYRASRERPL
ncbi:cobyrinate a,c-diamide synthase [Cohnella massiliensis]|uniref:cobyrinate a,c-diamide synthase n=1 Tax=Cohnella massiliensis TaxID=1816691 RepID=UPI0009B9F621|nr:cobyrinate a,c-diamide synthase [Cohnella massiliensis]